MTIVQELVQAVMDTMNDIRPTHSTFFITRDIFSTIVVPFIQIHVQVFGFAEDTYPYWQQEKRGLDFDGMIAGIEKMKESQLMNSDRSKF